MCCGGGGGGGVESVETGRAKEGQTEIQVAAASEARQQRGLHGSSRSR